MHQCILHCIALLLRVYTFLLLSLLLLCAPFLTLLLLSSSTLRRDAQGYKGCQRSSHFLFRVNLLSSLSLFLFFLSLSLRFFADCFVIRPCCLLAFFTAIHDIKATQAFLKTSLFPFLLSRFGCHSLTMNICTSIIVANPTFLIGDLRHFPVSRRRCLLLTHKVVFKSLVLTDVAHGRLHLSADFVAHCLKCAGVFPRTVQFIRSEEGTIHVVRQSLPIL
mmetsp:Transcript_26013/g.40840  ORF Transcript_26013/g.40840 Transcript_26013/m.40840 type:complete len:220 (-) Transcript_26013:746-1405(-)